MALMGRWRVEVRPVYVDDVARPLPGPPPAPRPRLTEFAVLTGLEGAALDEEIVAVRAHRSELAAYEAGLVARKAALGAAHPLPLLPGARTDVRTDGDEPTDPSLEAADDFLPDEVAALLRMSVPSARHLVEHDLVLVRQLPQVWHALADGRIDETRAAVIVKALRWQPAAHGGPVDGDVVAGVAALGVGWAERGCPPTTLRERLDAALVAADPAAADRRRELRTRGADVTVVGTGDGLSDLRAEQMESADAKLARAQLDAYARRLKAGGDDRPLGAIRIAVLLALITRPWEQRDPAVVHLTVDADLADLDGMPDLSALFPERTADQEAEHAGTADAEHAGTGTEGTGTEGTGTEGTGTEGTGTEGTGTEGTGTDATGDDNAGREGAGAAGADAQASGSRANADAVDRRDPGRGVGYVGGSAVSPSAVRELLRRIDALGLTDPEGGHLAFSLRGPGGSLLAVATPAELAAARVGAGLGLPPATPGYSPTAAQYRYLRARDRHCRFPGCRQVARACDADHVVPYDHRDPANGGPTCTTNLAMLCRRHHRLKTHAVGWDFRMDPDGTLHVTTPGGTTRVTRPPAVDEVLDLAHPPPPPHDPVTDPPPF